MRRRKSGGGGGDETEIGMSQLIDCVFLLLIFFLATTMSKRQESMVPFRLPDNTSSLSAPTEDVSLRVMVTRDFGYFVPAEGYGDFGAIKWKRVGDELSGYLNQMIRANSKVLSAPLTIEADGNIDFQSALRALDSCKLMGFEEVSMKTIPRKTLEEITSEMAKQGIKASNDGN